MTAFVSALNMKCKKQMEIKDDPNLLNYATRTYKKERDNSRHIKLRCLSDFQIESAKKQKPYKLGFEGSGLD
jgi:hypothetical protein